MKYFGLSLRGNFKVQTCRIRFLPPPPPPLLVAGWVPSVHRRQTWALSSSIVFNASQISSSNLSMLSETEVGSSSVTDRRSFFAASDLSESVQLFLFLSLKQILMNVKTMCITVTHKRLVLIQTEAIVVLVKQDSPEMVQCVQVCYASLQLQVLYHDFQGFQRNTIFEFSEIGF